MFSDTYSCQEENSSFRTNTGQCSRRREAKMRILREYVRSVLKESVSTEGYAVITGESFFNPSSVEAVLIDVSKFTAGMSTPPKTSLMTKLDVAKAAARNSVVGYINVGPPEEGEAWGAWEVTRAAGKGYGKLLYAIGYALSPKGLLMPDRTSVSADAENAWKKASKTHDFLQLDNLPPENMTDTPRDDAYLHDEEGLEFLDRAYKAQGWEKAAVDEMIAAGNRIETMLEKKMKSKARVVVGAFLSAGPSLFNRSFNA